MDRPRLIYYNDSHHFHGKRIDPPLSLHKMYWPVDELLGTGVDLLSFGLGFGDVYFHNSKIGRVIGQEQEVWEGFINWRIMRMVEDAEAMGTDQVGEVIKRGRETGLAVFPSLRLQDVALPRGERCGWLRWKYGEDVCLCQKDVRFPKHATEWAYDFTHELVLGEKLDMVREMLVDYGSDGIELDFMFFPLYFRQDETEAGIHVMNKFVGQVRKMANDIGQEQGRNIPIMARVWHRKEENLKIGLDVESWLREGDVDFVVGQTSAQLLDTSVLEARWLSDAANAAGAAAYFRAPRKINDPRAAIANIEMYRALGQTLQWLGFAGMYLGYLPWPLSDAEYAILREMAYPGVFVRHDKRYFLPPHEDGPEYAASDNRQLPLTLKEGKTALLRIIVADNLDSAKKDGEMRTPILTISFQFFCVEDDVEIRLNDTVLSILQADITEPQRGIYWFRYGLGADVLRCGENILEIELKELTGTAGFARIVTGVEIQTRYKDFLRPEGFSTERVVPTS